MNFWQAFKIALLGVLRDKGAVVPMVLGGLVYSFFYPLPYRPEVVEHVPVIVADYDASPLSRQFERDLDATRAVRVAGVTRRVEDAVPLMQRGEIGGIVAIPPNFDRDVLRGSPTGVTVMGNGGYIVVDGTILETAAEVLVSTTAAPLAAHLVESHVPPAALMRAAHAGPALIKQPMFNTVQGYASYVVPASTGLIVHQLLIIGICVVMGTWIERGRWTIAPQGRLSVRAFGGMLAGFWLFVWCAILFWIGFVFWIYDLPRAGNLSAGIVIGALYALAIAALGVSLGCWMADRERAFQVIGAVSIPLLFLSGFAFPVESIPAPMVWFSYLLPSTHGIQALLKFNQMGATWREASPQVIRLIVVTLAYMGLAWWMASRKAPGTALSSRRVR
ncbi:MAG TPA: ABC transporter permease [Steroidobacteraceae bacterium]|nr:ABC transporter permease [Steroidobacteraceae bacterium]